MDRGGLVAVVDHLDRVLPPRTRLHLFGIKGDAIPYLNAYRHRVASIDSQAYGVGARAAAHRQRRAKSDAFVADHMAHWLGVQRARLHQPTRRLPFQPMVLPALEPDNPWEAAIAQARREMRDLIEFGDLDHDEVTALWVGSEPPISTARAARRLTKRGGGPGERAGEPLESRRTP